MIYDTPEELKFKYGTPDPAGATGRFNATSKSTHDDDAYEYEFGFLNGHCLYAIIEKKNGGKITLEEAHGLRCLSGRSAGWKLNKYYDITKPAEIQKILDDPQENIGYVYSASAEDQFKGELLCVHQRTRHQLVIWHYRWVPDLSQVSAKKL